MKDSQTTRTIAKQKQFFQFANKTQLKYSTNSTQSIQLPKSMNIKTSSQQHHSTLSPNLLTQHIDLTITQFSIKCAMLINYIENMKNEFIAQIEGILPITLPSNHLGKSFHKRNVNLNINVNEQQLPFISTYKKGNVSNETRKRHIDRDVIISNRKNIKRGGYINSNNDGNNSNNNTVISSNCLKVKNQNISTQEQKIIKTFNYNTGNDSDDDNNKIGNKKSNKNIKKSDSELYRINFHSNGNNHSKKAHTEQINSKNHYAHITTNISAKTKALSFLIKQNMLDYQDKLKIKYLNKELYTSCENTTNILVNAIKHKSNELTTVKHQLTPNVPSLTSISNLCFIIKQHENDLLDESKPTNNKFYALTNILLNLNNNINIPHKEQYETLLQVTKMDSIRQIYLTLITKTLFNEIHKFPLDTIIQYVEYYEKNKCNVFLEQKDLVERKEIFISMIGFVMNDIYMLFKDEMNKRKRIETIQNDIQTLQQKMKKT